MFAGRFVIFSGIGAKTAWHQVREETLQGRGTSCPHRHVGLSYGDNKSDTVVAVVVVRLPAVVIDHKASDRDGSGTRAMILVNRNGHEQ